MESTFAARPKRVSGVLECPVAEELLLYLPNTETALALNVSARAVWSLCEGSRSVAEIAAALGEPLGLSGDAVLPDVCEAVQKLANLGLLRLS